MAVNSGTVADALRALQVFGAYLATSGLKPVFGDEGMTILNQDNRFVAQVYPVAGHPSMLVSVTQADDPDRQARVFDLASGSFV